MKKSLFSLNRSGYESFDAKASNHLYIFDAEVMVDLGIANNLYRIDLFLSDFSTYSSVTVMLSRNTLHHRRHILKLTMLFKILHNLVMFT